MKKCLKLHFQLSLSINLSVDFFFPVSVFEALRLIFFFFSVTGMCYIYFICVLPFCLEEQSSAKVPCIYQWKIHQSSQFSVFRRSKINLQSLPAPYNSVILQFCAFFLQFSILFSIYLLHHTISFDSSREYFYEGFDREIKILPIFRQG